MNDIINILSQVRIVSRKIKEQRKEKFERGENYNIFNDLGFMSDEVHLHSMFLANLLNPKGSHGQRGKFLEAFLKMLQKSFPAISADRLVLDTANASVEVEKYIGRQTDSEGGRIDIYLTDGKHSIIIENKIYAGDQHHQMLRYWNYEMSQKGDDTEKSFVLIYLTLDGCSPSKESLGEDLKENDIVCLSYKSDIREWLDRCVELASRTPLVRETINQYISTIDILTNNVMEDNKDLLDILCKEENLDAVFDIIDSKENLINHIINDEFIPKLKDLAEDKGLEICGNYKRNWVSDRYPGAHFQKTGWKFLDLAFQFESVGLDRMVFGFVCKGESNRSDVPTPVWEKVQEHYSISSPIKDKNNDLWIHKDFIGNKNWNNSQAIKNLRNGKTLNDFSIMFDEAIDCVKGLDI
ncbi:PD-(D/E)XK nuclease family protein [Leyella stercorea]|uniref:PDDEXK-like family protein n=1 Tax=Leyella stercorea TaxID=363265 RepID=UPI002431EC56|nr:PD-(D/E)XK nuclease family protein [Leyella stercorea]